MRNDQLEKFKRRLHVERENILLENLNANSQEIDGEGDEIDQASANEKRTLQVLLTNRNKGRLTQIEQAMARIAAGTFGICSGCEEEIESRRLEARPTAQMCVSCQEQDERVKKSFVEG